MSSKEERRSAVDYAAQEQRNQDHWNREETIEELIERCSRAMSRGRDQDYLWVIETLVDELIPMLERHTGQPVAAYDGKIDGDKSEWYFFELQDFIREPEPTIRTVTAISEDGPEQRRAIRQLDRILRSLTTIAQEEGIVLDSYAGRADGVGFELKLGEHLQDGRMDLGDPVELVTDEQVDAIKWLVCGGTGLGKSTGTERFVEDYYAASLTEGRDYNVLDLLGMRQGENWLPDVPQQQEDLRRVREEQDQPPSFVEDADSDGPNVQILHPLTRGLADKQFPYDVDEEEFVVKPFTIPASEFRKPVMVSLLMSRLSESEEATIREAYDEVDESKTDWSLKDLAKIILRRQELSDKHKSKAIGVLRSLQNEGFIRTHEDPYTLDWYELMDKTETYTIFSQARCDTDLAAYMTFAYLLDRIFRFRQGLNTSSEAVLVMRELWEVVPHKRRRSFDAREAAVQEAIGQMMMKTMRQNRHSGIHVVADTQEPSDLLKSVRELFNHYVVYSANKDTVQDIFEWTQNNKTRSFWSTMTAQAGQAGIVGQAKPAIENRDIEFVSPVEMIPPSHHHFDVKTDGTGWHARAKYFTPTEGCSECGGDIERSDDGYFVTCHDCGHEELDASGGRCEQLRRPSNTEGVEWDDTVPEKLQIPTFSEHTDSSGDSSVDPSAFPVRAFANRCVERKAGTNISKWKVYDAFNAFVEDYDLEPWDFNERGVTIQFGNKMGGNVKGELKSTNAKDGQGKAYQDLDLTALGEQYLEQDGSIEILRK